jgi:hypothetical protein
MPSHLWYVGAAQKSHGHPGAQLQFFMYSALNLHSVATMNLSPPELSRGVYNVPDRSDNVILDER